MRKVVKIVTFYDDGTFTESTPSLAPMPTPPVWNTPSPVYGPIVNPNPWTQPYPSYPPYTIWCKQADGTTTEFKMDSPIVAQNTTKM